MKKIGIFAFALLLTSNILFAKPTKTWQEWYTFSRNNQPTGYYVEVVSLKESTNEFTIQQSIIEKGSDGIQNTYVTATANNDAQLTPISFYVKKRSHTTIDIYEGIVSNSDIGIRVHLGTHNNPPETLIIKLTKSSILGVFTPLYIAKNYALKKISANKAFTFQTLLEEGNEGKYELSEMKVILKENKITINGLACNAFDLQFNNIKATWWISEQGKLCKMTIPSLGATLQLSKEEIAKKYL